MLRHKNWIQQLRKDLKVVEYLGGKAMEEDTATDKSSEEF
jgi:hypothetical protein